VPSNVVLESSSFCKHFFKEDISKGIEMYHGNLSKSYLCISLKNKKGQLQGNDKTKYQRESCSWNY